MAISDSQKVDLLYKKLFGVSKTELAANKGASNESIASPAINRGDRVWTQSNQIPATAASVSGVVQAYLTTNRIECVADNTTVAVGGVFPTWKTNLTNWIPPEFGATYSVSVYAQPSGNANPTNDTPLSDAGSGGSGEWFFDYQSGVLNFIGGTIPAALTSAKVIYVTGYRYVGLTGVTQLPSANVTGNVNAGNVITDTIVANTLVIPGLSLGDLVTSNVSTTTTTSQTIVANSITANIWNGIYTSNVIESANSLYYTNARVYANISPLLNYKANVSDLTTANVAELNNLYYTNARTYSNVTQLLPSYSGNVAAGNVTIGSGTGGSIIGANLISATIVSATVWQGLSFANVSGINTANVPEFNNLYYTNARVYSNVIGLLNVKANVTDLTTSNVVEGIQLYYTNARVYSNVSPLLAAKANVVDLTTANVVEFGNNIYYTNARVYSNISLALPGYTGNIKAGNITTGGGNGGSITGANLISTNTISATNWVGLNSSSIIGLNTANIAEFNNLYYTDARVYSNVAPLLALKANIADLTTANVLETTNLYYTNARVRSTLSPGTGVSYDVYSGVIGIGQSVATTANVTFGSLNVTGVTNFYGNVITHSSNNLSISDNMFYLNSGSEASNPDVGFAFNYNDGVYHHGGFFRDATDGTFKVFDNYTPEPDANIFIDTSHATFRLANLSGTTFFGNVVGNVSGFISSIGNFSTSDLAEGTRLYYTNSRVRSALSGGTGVSYDNSTGAISIGQNVATTASVTFADVDVSASLKPTTDQNIDIGTGSAQFRDIHATGTIGPVNSLTISGSSEIASYGSNVHLNAGGGSSTWQFKSDGTLIAPGNISANYFIGNISGSAATLDNFTTSNLAEGINLYYTNARVNAQVESNLALKANITDLTTANVLETTNLYYTNARVNAQVESNLALKANVVDLTTANVLETTNLYYTNARVNAQVESNLALKANITDLTTSNVVEGNQLYYSNARVNAQVASNLALKANVVDLTTSNVVEGNQLYYTNARVHSAMVSGTGVSVDTSSGAISIGQNVATTANVTFASLNVTGPVNFYSNVTTHSSNNLSVSDNMIYLNNDSDSSNPDLGITFNYNDGTYHHAGFFRDASDGVFKVFDNYGPEPDANIFINTEHATFRLANIQATAFIGNVVGTASTVSSLSNFTTANLAEGFNLYYSNARVYSNVAHLIALKANVSDLTTANVAEVDNLYYTNARVNAIVQPSVAELRALVTRFNANVLYVATNGNDANDGTTFGNAFANIHVALAAAQPWTTVFLKSGEYVLHNQPVTIPRRVALVGDNLRTTTIRPSQTNVDMFYVNNACYVTGITFRDHVSPAAVFSYNPDGSAGYIATSPYIQNCSSITTTGTGMRVDGRYVSGLRSMVCDAYTQTNEGGIGIHMLHKGYTQLVSVFTICCHIAIKCETGGFCSITNSNASFGTYGLMADGVSEPLYYGKVATGTTEATNDVVINNLSVKPNYGDAVLFANYNQTKCARDAGLIVDSLAIDLAYGSNTQATFAGLQYWAQPTSAIPGQKVETLDAINKISFFALQLAQGDFVSPTYQSAVNPVLSAAGTGAESIILNNLITRIYQTIDEGTAGITDVIVPNNWEASTDTNVLNAASILISNKAFIAAEVVAYINTTYPSFTYNTATCARDVGYIIDSITFDLVHGGNRQSVMAGVYYYQYDATDTQINDQVVQTGASYYFIGNLVNKIVQGTVIANVYQNAVVQNTTAASYATQATANLLLTDVNLIANIVVNGPSAAPAKAPITTALSSDTDVINATKLLVANKDFIKAEVIAFVNQNWANISNGAATFYTVKSATELVGNTSTVTLLETVTNNLLANSTVSFHQGSYISSSGHTFEYVGSGDQIATALPYLGGVPKQENEVIEMRGGKVYFTSTDQLGDFRIGKGLVINRVDGTITGRTFNKALFAVMTPYMLAIEG